MDALDTFFFFVIANIPSLKWRFCSQPPTTHTATGENNSAWPVAAPARALAKAATAHTQVTLKPKHRARLRPPKGMVNPPSFCLKHQTHKTLFSLRNHNFDCLKKNPPSGLNVFFFSTFYFERPMEKSKFWLLMKLHSYSSQSGVQRLEQGVFSSTYNYVVF